MRLGQGLCLAIAWRCCEATFPGPRRDDQMCSSLLTSEAGQAGSNVEMLMPEPSLVRSREDQHLASGPPGSVEFPSRPTCQRCRRRPGSRRLCHGCLLQLGPCCFPKLAGQNVCTACTQKEPEPEPTLTEPWATVPVVQRKARIDLMTDAAAKEFAAGEGLLGRLRERYRGKRGGRGDRQGPSPSSSTTASRVAGGKRGRNIKEKERGE